MINDEFGTEYELETPWTDILAPGTLPKSPNAGGEFVSQLAGWGSGCGARATRVPGEEKLGRLGVGAAGLWHAFLCA